MADIMDRDLSSNRHLAFSMVDFVPRVLLVSLFGYSGFQFGTNALSRIGPAVAQGWFSAGALQIYPMLGKSIFYLAIAFLAVVRLRRIDGDYRLYAQFVALAGTFFLLLLLLISARPVLPETIAIASSALMLIGSIASVAVVIQLGQSFSILPEARRLVVSGPYRFVRHPLYLVEELMMVGIFMTYPLGWTLFMIACHGFLQIERMRLEENVLKRSFPDYAEYARHTARLIPGIY